METFQTLHTDDCVFTMNGAHQLSGTYNGMADFMERMMSQIPSVFPPNFSLVNEWMIAEGNTVFTYAKARGDGLDAYFGLPQKLKAIKSKKLLFTQTVKNLPALFNQDNSLVRRLAQPHQRLSRPT